MEKVQSHRQWPQCSSNRLTRTYQSTRAKVTVRPRHLCCLCTDQFLQIRFLFLFRSCLCNSRLQQSAFHNSVSRYTDTRSTAVLFVIYEKISRCQCGLHGHCSSAHSQWKRVSLWLVKCQTLRMQRACLAQGLRCLLKKQFHLHAIHACTWAFFSIFRLSLPRHQPHLHLRSQCRSVKPCDDPQNEEYGSVAKTTSSTGYEPNVIDNFDYSDT